MKVLYVYVSNLLVVMLALICTRSRQVPMFEVYAGPHSEYLGTVGGLILDDQDIVSYRIDANLETKIKNRAVLRVCELA
jgi:hypothetical protein